MSDMFYPDPRGIWFFVAAFVILGVIKMVIKGIERK